MSDSPGRSARFFRLGALARWGGAALLTAGLGVAVLRPPASAEQPARRLPAAAIDVPAGDGAPQIAVFSGGCFWGVQGVFEHVKGVTRAVSGYAGGDAATAHYMTVSTGTTGHAESVRVTFDPRQVTYGELLRVFFSVAMDPTELNYQGPDEGTQYRSELWYTDPTQQRVARAYIAQLGAAHVYSAPIVTRVDPLPAFYPAEAYHQDFLERNPDQPYIHAIDMPKVENLKRLFPELYRASPVLVRPDGSASSFPLSTRAAGGEAG